MKKSDLEQLRAVAGLLLERELLNCARARAEATGATEARALAKQRTCDGKQAFRETSNPRIAANYDTWLAARRLEDARLAQAEEYYGSVCAERIKVARRAFGRTIALKSISRSRSGSSGL